jgi:hypothetical protein
MADSASDTDPDPPASAVAASAPASSMLIDTSQSTAAASASSSASLTADAVAYESLISTPSDVVLVDVNDKLHPIDRLLRFASGPSILASLAVSFTDERLEEWVRNSFTVLKDVRKLILHIGLKDAHGKSAVMTLQAQLLKAVREYRRRHNLPQLNPAMITVSDEEERENINADAASTSRRNRPARSAALKKKSTESASSASASSSSSLIPSVAAKVLDRLPSLPRQPFSRRSGVGGSKSSIPVGALSGGESESGSSDSGSAYESPPLARRAPSRGRSNGRGKRRDKSPVAGSGRPPIRLFPASAPSSLRDDGAASGLSHDSDSSSSDEDRFPPFRAPLGPRDSSLFPSSSKSYSGVDVLPRAQREQVLDELDGMGQGEPLAREWIRSVLCGQGPNGTIFRVMKYDQRFTHTRNARECQAWAKVIDALLAGDLILAMETAVRRCAGVQAADMSNNWDLCDQFELVMENQSFIPARFMQRALKNVTRLQHVKRSAKLTSSSQRGKDGKDTHYNKDKPVSGSSARLNVSSGATPAGRSTKK